MAEMRTIIIALKVNDFDDFDRWVATTPDEVTLRGSLLSLTFDTDPEVTVSLPVWDIRVREIGWLTEAAQKYLETNKQEKREVGSG